MFPEKDDRSEFIRTTVYLPRHLHESVKLMAIMTRCNASKFMRIALTDKIKQLKDEKK